MIIILYAFNMQQHRSLYGRKCKSVEEAVNALMSALNKGAQVISVRVYEK